MCAFNKTNASNADTSADGAFVCRVTHYNGPFWVPTGGAGMGTM